MNIGQAAEHTNLPPKTIRYYEDIELVVPERSANGYRRFSREDIHFLRFVQCARSLGFSIEECRLLMSLYQDQSLSGAEIKSIAFEMIGKIDRKQSALVSLRMTLSALATKCGGHNKPHYPVINDIGEPVRTQ